MDKPVCNIFKTREEELKYIKKNMLTTGKLIKWLSQFPEDTLIYRIESNTGDWQEIPDFNNYEDKIGNQFIKTVEQDKKEIYDFNLRWFKDYPDKEDKAKKEVADVHKYTEDEGICINV